MTVLATHAQCPGQLDLLESVADDGSALASLHMDDFREACEAVADSEGYVNPNLVSAWLHAKWGDINPRSYSAKWAPACGRHGFMDKTGRTVQIDGRHSKGNSNKDVFYRRLRSAA